MKQETSFRRSIDHKLKAIPNSWWESISQKSIRGTPDKIGCINGHFVALEFKRSEKAKVDRLQLHKLAMIYKSGGVAHVVYPENWELVYNYLLTLSLEAPSCSQSK